MLLCFVQRYDGREALPGGLVPGSRVSQRRAPRASGSCSCSRRCSRTAASSASTRPCSPPPAEHGVSCQVLTLNDPAAALEPAPVPGRRAPGVLRRPRSDSRSRSPRALWLGDYDSVSDRAHQFPESGRRRARRSARSRAARQVVLVAHGIEVWSGIGRRGACRCAGARAPDSVRQPNTPGSGSSSRRRRLEPGRLTLFPNALSEIWRDAVGAESARALPERFILSVTRLEKGDRYKGIVTVIEALSMLEDASLHYCVIGQGDDLPFLQRVAERSGVAQRVHFLRGVSDAELITLYGRCAAFVLPSGKEGFGIVFLEAMYFGAPVIAAAEKGALDVVQDGETGLLVRFGDTVALQGGHRAAAAGRRAAGAADCAAGAPRSRRRCVHVRPLRRAPRRRPRNPRAERGHERRLGADPDAERGEPISASASIPARWSDDIVVFDSLSEDRHRWKSPAARARASCSGASTTMPRSATPRSPR